MLAAWRRAGLQSTQVLKHITNCNGARGPDCRGGRACGDKNGYFRVKRFGKEEPV